MLSREEKDILYRLGQAWNLFVSLDRQHPDELEEFRRAIHAAQNLIAVRLARKVQPDIFPIKVGDV